MQLMPAPFQIDRGVDYVTMLQEITLEERVFRSLFFCVVGGLIQAAAGSSLGIGR